MSDAPHDDADARTEYATRLETRRASLLACRRQHRLLGNLRLAVLVAAIAMAAAAFGSSVFSPWWLVVPVAVLVRLGTRMRRLESLDARLSRAVEFYERGLERLNGDWAGKGETGERFTTEPHLYARDLDVFGHASLFELLCRARTGIGEETLAAWLASPAPPDRVRTRQGAILELGPLLDLREDLALAGEHARPGVHAAALIEWGEGQPRLKSSWFRAAAAGLSILGAAGVAAVAVHIAAAAGSVVMSDDAVAGLQAYYLSIGLICLIVLWWFRTRTSGIIRDVEKAARDLGLLADLIRRFEAEAFTAPYLVALRSEFERARHPASWQIGRLGTFVELLESGRTLLMQLAGPFLLWNLHLSYAIEDWRRTSGPEIRRWLHAVGEMEAILSLACFWYERPRYVFPQFVPEGPLFAAQELGHPLLPPGRVVSNDISLGHPLQVLIVSGSNMSGKSTLLRTVGINAVLAQAGAPVCARRLSLSPLTVGASIRIQDSLHEGTSRFYAEISRLRLIMEAAREPTAVLFLIDELLHGTNSHDRLTGAEAIVQGLIVRRALGLITTHDLALTRIAASLHSRGANVHFQDYLEGGQLRFDYRLREGVVEHSNALELMRSVGLDV